MVDERGRVILVHGVNAVWKVPPYTPPDTAAGFTDADAQFLVDNGMNGVRLGVIFAGVMPERGRIDEAYLEASDRVVRLLEGHGIWVQIDFHQDLYSERFGGEGFPPWAVFDDGLPHLLDLGFPANYFTLEVSHTFDNFYANRSGIWDEYRDAWKAVAAKWKDRPNLLGYDLMNEPWPGILWPTCLNPFGCPLVDQRIDAMQRHMLAGIREVDPTTIVWFEPLSTFNSGAQTSLGTFGPIGDANLGLSWHDYCPHAALLHAAGFQDLPGCEIFHTLDFANVEVAIARLGSTTLLSEFGASDDLPDIANVLSLADRHLTGWLYWHYKEWSDPTTESQESGGQGMFEKDDDLSTLKSAKADLLIRTYPQATAGIPLAMSFDSTTGAFSYRYTPRAASGPTEIFAPARHYPNGYDVVVTGGTVTSSPGARVVRIDSAPGTAEVSVAITAKP